MPRHIDHLVFAVRDLASGRHFFEQLGFAPAPKGVHPFGTANYNVFLDRSFVEILGVENSEKIIPHQDNQLSFSAFNQDFLREREGVSMIVIQTEDAVADYHRLRAAGISCSAPFHFARDQQMADGGKEEVAFTTSFFQAEAMQELAFFVCQHHHPEHIWQEAYQRHSNTALRIHSIDLVTEEPEKIRAFMSTIFDHPEIQDEAGAYVLSNGHERVRVMTQDVFKQHFPSALLPDSAFVGAITFEVSDLKKLISILADHQIPFQDHGEEIRIRESDAFGVHLIFKTV